MELRTVLSAALITSILKLLVKEFHRVTTILRDVYLGTEPKGKVQVLNKLFAVLS